MSNNSDTNSFGNSLQARTNEIVTRKHLCSDEQMHSMYMEACYKKVRLEGKELVAKLLFAPVVRKEVDADIGISVVDLSWKFLQKKMQDTCSLNGIEQIRIGNELIAHDQLIKSDAKLVQEILMSVLRGKKSTKTCMIKELSYLPVVLIFGDSYNQESTFKGWDSLANYVKGNILLHSDVFNLPQELEVLEPVIYRDALFNASISTVSAMLKSVIEQSNSVVGDEIDISLSFASLYTSRLVVAAGSVCKTLEVDTLQLGPDATERLLHYVSDQLGSSTLQPKKNCH